MRPRFCGILPTESARWTLLQRLPTNRSRSSKGACVEMSVPNQRLMAQARATPMWARLRRLRDRPASGCGPSHETCRLRSLNVALSESRHRFAAGVCVRVKSVLRGLNHEYSLETATVFA